MVLGQTVWVALPGVPAEMYAMFANEVKPRLQARFGAGAVLLQRKLNCFGAGESAIEEKVLDLTRHGHVPEVGITVSDTIVSFRILAHAPSRDEALRQIEPVERTLRERLGELVFGVEDELLQDAVIQLLQEKQRTLAVAESVTGGMLAQCLTQVPGASAYFRGGVVAYTNAVKTELLAVPQRLLDEHGAVSAPVVEAMATACRIRLGADLALSTVGLAGPGGDTSDRPVGLVHVGLAWKDGVRSLRYQWFGTRQEIQSRTTKLALNVARLHLLHS
jgi:nicotinamide-nucleotide amidase